MVHTLNFFTTIAHHFLACLALAVAGRTPFKFPTLLLLLLLAVEGRILPVL